MTEMSDKTVPERDSQPRYRKIADALLADIGAGRYEVGAMLPAEAELCEQFHASRFTIREALRWLADHGVIDRRRGSGTRVISDAPPETFVYRFASVAEMLKYPADTWRENLYRGHIHADPELADKINCPIGKEWYRISGLRRSDGSDLPISWSDIFVLPEFAAILQDETDTRVPVYEQIERATGTRIADAEIRIYASAIEGKLARMLEVTEGAPALSIIRRYLDDRGRNFETTVTVHPGRRFEYSMHLQRDTSEPHSNRGQE